MADCVRRLPSATQRRIAELLEIGEVAVGRSIDRLVDAGWLERMGEVVRACVVLKSGAALTLDDVRAHFFASGIAKQKTPERLSILAELPRNASGKVLKHELRAIAASAAL